MTADFILLPLNTGDRTAPVTVVCPECFSDNVVFDPTEDPEMPFDCFDCGCFFSREYEGE